MRGDRTYPQKVMNPDSLLNFSIAAAPGGIEAQEAQGQSNFVNSTTLPQRINGDQSDWEILEGWGVVRGDLADDLFVHVTLPDGWQKRPTDHSMWSELVDGQGLKRASLFYKAAFYDRDAFINVITNRYFATKNYDDDGHQYEVRDAATGAVVQTFTRGYYALKNGQLGFVFGDRFYFEAQGQYSNNSYFARNEAAAADLELISDDRFYKEFHHVNPVHHVIFSAESLAAKEAIELAEKMNDESGWLGGL